MNILLPIIISLLAGLFESNVPYWIMINWRPNMAIAAFILKCCGV